MAEVLSRAGRFRTVSGNLGEKGVRHGGKRYVVCMNPEQAEHDLATKEAIVEYLQAKLKRGASSLIGNSGYRRYLESGRKPEDGATRIPSIA